MLAKTESKTSAEGGNSAGQRRETGLLTIFAAFFVVGLTAFGMAILQKLKALVLGRGWLSEEEMNEGLAMVQLYPGPIMVDFTAYTGYKLRGTLGAALATVGFITPTFVLMLFLSAAYFAAGSLPWVSSLFVGLDALVVGVVFNVTLDLGRQALKGRVEAVIALAAFVALIFRLNAIMIVFGALATGALFARPRGMGESRLSRSLVFTGPQHSKRPGYFGIAFAAIMVLGVALLAWLTGGTIGRMSMSFFKIGSVAFGNGMTILPLIQADTVNSYHWLTMHQFADGIALSQITPGPFLIIATFIGYKLGGVWAALLATFAMFAPSFVMTLIFTEFYGRVRDLRPVKGALAGVLASFVGLLAVVVMQLGHAGITGSASLTLAASAFIAVRYFKLDILWVFVIGLAAWGGIIALGIV